MTEDLKLNIQIKKCTNILYLINNTHIKVFQKNTHSIVYVLFKGIRLISFY